MKCSATPGGGASTTGSRSRAKNRAAAPPSRPSRGPTRGRRHRGGGSTPSTPRFRRDAAGEEPVDRLLACRHPLRECARTTPSISHALPVRLAGAIGRRVDRPRQRRRRTIGQERQRDLAAVGVADHGVRRRRPALRPGNQGAESAAHAATVCGGSNAGESPCSRRSTSAAGSSGRRAASGPADRGPVAATAVDARAAGRRCGAPRRFRAGRRSWQAWAMSSGRARGGPVAILAVQSGLTVAVLRRPVR